jgi:hypothetical protein
MNLKNKYIKLLVNGILFVSILFVADLAIGKGARHLFFEAKAGFDYHLIYSMDSTEADIIILGSSRACRHYVPAIFEDTLNMTCFNTGLDGNYFFNNYAVYKAITERYSPKIVLLDLNPDMIYPGRESYDQLASHLPFYKDHSEIRDIIDLRSKHEKLKLISEIYPFNSTLLRIAKGILKTEDINEFKGYTPLFGNLPEATSLSYLNRKQPEIDTTRIRILSEMADDCNRRNIELILIQSPMYIEVDQEASVSVIDSISAHRGVPFWNYVNDTVFLKAKYFRDESHLNDMGAHEFTKVIASRIKHDMIPAEVVTKEIEN